MPPAIRSFLKAHDLSGEVLASFVTHGGYGLGNSRSIFASHALNIQVRHGFSLGADQGRRMISRVVDWLGESDSRG